MAITDQEIDERNAQRDRKVLDAAYAILSTRGVSGLTRDAIAAQADLSPASVSNFGRARISNGTHAREGYRTRILSVIMERAVADGDVKTVRIGLVDGCLKARDVPTALREQAGV